MSEVDETLTDTAVIAVPCYSKYSPKNGLNLTNLRDIAKRLHVVQVPSSASKRDICKALNNIQEAKKVKELADILTTMGYIVEWKIEKINFNDQIDRDGKKFVKVKWLNRAEETYEPIEKLSYEGKTFVKKALQFEPMNAMSLEQQHGLSESAIVAIANSSLGTFMLEKNGTGLICHFKNGTKERLQIPKSTNVFAGPYSFYVIDDSGVVNQFSFEGRNQIPFKYQPPSGVKYIKVIEEKGRGGGETFLLSDNGEIHVWKSLIAKWNAVAGGAKFIDVAMGNSTEGIGINTSGELNPLMIATTFNVPEDSFKAIVCQSSGVYYGLKNDGTLVKFGKLKKFLSEKWSTKFSKITTDAGIGLDGKIYSYEYGETFIPERQGHKFVAIDGNMALYDDAAVIDWHKTMEEHRSYREANPQIAEEENRRKKAEEERNQRAAIEEKLKSEFAAAEAQLKSRQETLLNNLKTEEQKEAAQLEADLRRVNVGSVYYVPYSIDARQRAEREGKLHREMVEKHRQEIQTLQTSPNYVNQPLLQPKMMQDLLKKQSIELQAKIAEVTKIMQEELKAKELQAKEKAKQEEEKLLAERKTRREELERKQSERRKALIATFEQEQNAEKQRQPRRVDEEIAKLAAQDAEVERKKAEKRKLQQEEREEKKRLKKQEEDELEAKRIREEKERQKQLAEEKRKEEEPKQRSLYKANLAEFVEKKFKTALNKLPKEPSSVNVVYKELLHVFHPDKCKLNGLPDNFPISPLLTIEEICGESFEYLKRIRDIEQNRADQAEKIDIEQKRVKEEETRMKKLEDEKLAYRQELFRLVKKKYEETQAQLPNEPSSIITAYKKLVLLFHPDKCKLNGLPDNYPMSPLYTIEEICSILFRHVNTMRQRKEKELEDAQKGK